MLSSPRKPSITIRIFSSAENRRRVFRRMSRTVFSADSYFAMDSFSSRSQEPSLRSSTKNVQTRLTAYTDDVQSGASWKSSLNRLERANPQDAADGVAFLCSDAERFVTGLRAGVSVCLTRRVAQPAANGLACNASWFCTRARAAGSGAE